MPSDRDESPFDRSEVALFARYEVADNPGLQQRFRCGDEFRGLQAAVAAGARNRAVHRRPLPRLALVHPLVEAEPGPPPEDATAGKELTWIQIRLLDEIGDPMPGAAYKLKLPNGGEISGTLDAKGEARHDGIEPGRCEVSFPDVDQRPLPAMPA